MCIEEKKDKKKINGRSLFNPMTHKDRVKSYIEKLLRA